MLSKRSLRWRPSMLTTFCKREPCHEDVHTRLAGRPHCHPGAHRIGDRRHKGQAKFPSLANLPLRFGRGVAQLPILQWDLSGPSGQRMATPRYVVIPGSGFDDVPVSPTARVPPSRFWNCAAGINAALSESIAMGSTAAHLHNEEEVEHEVTVQASHLDLLCLLICVQNASQEGAAPNNLSLRAGRYDCRLLRGLCSRSLET